MPRQRDRVERAYAPGSTLVRVGPDETDWEVMEPGQRLCGYRLVGGIYWTTAVEGEDAQHLFFEQPINIDPAALGISPVGVTFIERPVGSGQWHVIDWVGESHYPTPESFQAEVARMGLSRRMPRSLDFARLDEDSRILLVHRHAGRDADGNTCPAIFGSFPITALEIIHDESDAAVHILSMERAERATGVPISLVAR